MTSTPKQPTPEDAPMPTPYPIESLDRAIARVDAWSRRMFPQSTAYSTLVHIKRECREVLDVQPEDAGLELADLIVLISQWARLSGSTLAQLVEAKMAINYTRQYMPPDADGVMEHDRSQDPC